MLFQINVRPLRYASITCATKIIKIYRGRNKKNIKKIKMRFKEYIYSLPNQRKEEISKIMELCRVNESTVYRWLRGDFTPAPQKRKVISDYLNIPEQELFPDA